MPVQRPGVVTAAGVLCIIYGSVFTLCGLCGVMSLAVQGAAGGNPFAGGDPMQQKLQKDLQDIIEREVPAYQAFQIGGTVAGLLVSILLLVGGIGLLQMRPSARTLSLTFAWIAIALAFFQAFYQLVFVMPAMKSAFQVALPAALAAGPAGGPGAAPVPPQVLQALEAIMTITVIVMIFIYGAVVVYLVVIVILLSRGRVRLAFADAARGDFGPPPGFEDGRRERARDYGWEDDAWDRPPPLAPPPSGPADDRIKE